MVVAVIIVVILSFALMAEPNESLATRSIVAALCMILLLFVVHTVALEATAPRGRPSTRELIVDMQDEMEMNGAISEATPTQ